MDIKTSKIELVKLILNIDNDQFLQRVLDFINDEQADFWNELSESERQEIQKGITELNAGKRSSYEDVLKRIS